MSGGSTVAYPNTSAPSNAPRNVKNNNPGSLRISINAWKGKRKKSDNTDGAFEQFSTMVDGCRAHIKNLQAYFKGGEDTVHSIIDDGKGRDWSPAFENNPTAYIKFLCDYLKVKPDQHLPWSPDLIVDFCFAMSQIECGKSPFITRQNYVDAFNLIK
jgi:hypothetical protein